MLGTDMDIGYPRVVYIFDVAGEAIKNENKDIQYLQLIVNSIDVPRVISMLIFMFC
jgi:hypothetical protein